MKIAQLCLSPAKGGLELYVWRVVRRLARSGIECLTIVAPGSKLEALLQTDGLHPRTLTAVVRVLPLASAWRLARWIDAERIDVLHMHWGKDLNLAVLARRLARRPVRLVYTRQMAITRPKHDWYHRVLYRYVDLFLVITNRLQQEAQRFLPLPAERIQLLYYGVESPPPTNHALCHELRATARIPPGRFALGLFGRIEPAKGQHILIEALAKLSERGSDVHAVLFGHAMEPRYLDELRAQAVRLGVNERVHFFGFHPRPTEVMGCLDAVVLTTYKETFGLVLIEAMRAGVAVIGTDAGGVPEIIDHGQTGLLVAPQNPTALADAIERLVRDPGLRARLAAAGKASADARFTEERHFEQLFGYLRGDMA